MLKINNKDVTKSDKGDVISMGDMMDKSMNSPNQSMQQIDRPTTEGAHMRNGYGA